MKPLWEQSWFCKTVNYLNDHWSFWKTYIYGESINMEDFVRNPAEVLRDTVPPFVFKDVKKPLSILLLRIGYIPYRHEDLSFYTEELMKVFNNDITKVEKASCTYWDLSKELGDHLYGFNLGYTRYDIGLFNKWWTKYPNSFIMIQFALSFWNYIPIPYFSFNLRFTKRWYLQLGFGWGPQINGGKTDACLSAKFRLANYLDEAKWNPDSEVFGFYEGTN